MSGVAHRTSHSGSEWRGGAGQDNSKISLSGDGLAMGYGASGHAAVREGRRRSRFSAAGAPCIGVTARAGSRLGRSRKAFERNAGKIFSFIRRWPTRSEISGSCDVKKLLEDGRRESGRRTRDLRERPCGIVRLATGQLADTCGIPTLPMWT